MAQSSPSRRLTREASRLRTRADLLAAAKLLFVEKGFGATSLRDIAAQAGYTQGAFYSNFADKEALFIELMQSRASAQLGEVAQMLGDPALTQQAMLGALDAWSKRIDDEPEWAVLGIEFELQAGRSVALANASRALWSAHRDGFARCIELVFARLDLVPPEAPPMLAASFMALSHGLALQRPILGEVPAGQAIMVFLRGLIAAAKPVTRAKKSRG
ncbi:helix-turn-helix domain-containing protein [Paraburkholderia sp. J67]|uniref:TetR/AcrR family transcriptional regulator n=1 Tax=Paraburkholderia sp. J67 TaxID=2805435 RepID=UPI002ABE1C9D|nr:helix-turn-helix domain-containing protein [Paraburkholderia sp. J67]